MATNSTPIRRTLMSMVMLTSGVVLLLSTAASFAYEFLSYRQSAAHTLAMLGDVIANNSTAALAFSNADDAASILAALKAEPHIVAAALYDKQGELFATYEQSSDASLSTSRAPIHPGASGYGFDKSYLAGFQPVVENERRLGTLYLKSDTGAINDQLRVHGAIIGVVIAISCLVAYLLSRSLQRRISQPILSLAETARAISDRRDYSVRADQSGGYELHLLTEAFNHMLAQIQEQHGKLNSQLGN